MRAAVGVWALVLWLGWCGVAAGQDGPLTTDDVVLLSELEFSDGDIMAEVERRGVAFEASALEALDGVVSAGVLEALRARLEPVVLSADDVVRLLGEGITPEEVIRRIEAGDSRFSLSAQDVLALREAGVPMEVLRVMRARPSEEPVQPLSTDDVARLLGEGVTPEEVIRRIEASDSRFSLSAQDVLALREAGVPMEVLRVMRARPSVPATASEGEPTTEPRAVPTEPTGSVEGLEFVHPTYAYRLAGPSGWSVEPGEDRENEPFEVVFRWGEEGAVSVNLLPIEDPGEWDARSLQQALLEGAQEQGAELEVQGRFQWTLDGMVFEGVGMTQVDEETGERRRGAHMVGVADEVLVFVQVSAPEAAWEAFEPRVDELLSGLEVPAVPVRRQPVGALEIGPEQSNRSIVEALQPSVVMVRGYQQERVGGDPVYLGSGSGVIVHEQGYVLTNRHVVLLGQEGDFDREPVDAFLLTWDQREERPPVEAVLVGISERFDVACLRIVTPGTYTPVWLGDVREVRAGDDGLVLGFPRPDQQGALNMGVNSGSVSAVEQDTEGRIRWIRHMIRTDQGNSGGPLFDSSIGGVIGLHTAVRRVVRTDEHPEEAAVHELSWAAVPIHEAIREFPQILAAERADAFTVWEREQRAYFFLRQKRLGAAAAEARVLLTQDPNSAYGLAVLASVQLRQGDRQEALRALRKLARVHSEEPFAVSQLSQLYAQLGEQEESLRWSERLVELAPERWSNHVVHANALARLGRYEDAQDELEVADRLTNGVNSFIQMHFAQVAVMRGRAQGQLYQEGGRWVIERGLKERVEYFCERAIELRGGGNPEAWGQLARLAIYENDPEGALAYCAEGLERSPMSAQLHVVASELSLRALGDVQGGLRHASRSLQIEESAAGYYFYSTAVLLMLQSEQNAGVAQQLVAVVNANLERCLELSPRGPYAPDALYVLGLWSLRAGDRAGGLRNLRRCLELKPEHQNARNALDQLGASTGGGE